MIFNKKIVVVLPAYNAAATLEKTYNEIDLLLQRYLRAVRVIEHIPHHPRKLFNDFRGVGRLDGSQVIKAVQGIEEKMGVDLFLQETELTVQVLIFYFPFPGFNSEPFFHKTEHADEDHYEKHRH